MVKGIDYSEMEGVIFIGEIKRPSTSIIYY